MPSQIITTYDIDYTRKRDNGSPVSSTAQITQRWPVTRSRAGRAVVAHLIEHSQLGQEVWQWYRLDPVIDGPFTAWAAPAA